MQDILSGRMASNPRNKQIAAIFKEAGIIEKYGSGIKRVLQVMADLGSSEPIFEILGDNFKVTLFSIREIKGGGVTGGVTGGVSDLFDFIRANPGLKTKDIKAAMDLPQRTMERWLRELREQHKIKFQGAPKTGGYYPIE